MLVVDASVAVKWLIEEPGTADAMDLLNGSDAVIALDLVVAEVANVVWKHLIRGAMVTADQRFLGRLAASRWLKRCRPLVA